MTELKPGTPEYDEAYKKEMERLEAEANKPADKKADKKAETTYEADDAGKPAKKADDQAESADEIKARLDKAERALEKAQKAIEDTKRWGHKNAGEVARLKKEADERKHREAIADDPLIKANPGLEETIKRVAQPAEVAKPAHESWLDTVATAIPDVETLLGEKEFYAKAAARKSELGDDWNNPLIAIRELSAMRTEHLTQKNVTAAVEAARKDFEVKSKKRTAMEVPGGSGGKDATSQGEADEVRRYQTMSREELNKVRSKVLGY